MVERFDSSASQLHFDEKTTFRKRTPMALRVCFLCDMALSELEITSFEDDEFALDDVAAAILKPFLRQLELGVVLKVGAFSYNCVGTLHDIRCDMEGCWKWM